MSNFTDKLLKEIIKGNERLYDPNYKLPKPKLIHLGGSEYMLDLGNR